MTHDELLLFGERVRRRRNDLGCTQEQVSGAIGVSLRFYQMIERGEKSISLETLIGLSRAMSVSVDYLLFGELPNSVDNPIADLLHKLSPQQRDDAVKLLQIYSNACNH